MKKKKYAIGIGAAVAVAASIALIATPAMAYNNVLYYGYNNCAGQGAGYNHPALHSIDTYDLVHQISPGSGYYVWNYNSGSSYSFHDSREQDLYASWGTIGWNGDQNSPFWTCDT